MTASLAFINANGHGQKALERKTRMTVCDKGGMGVAFKGGTEIRI